MTPIDFAIGVIFYYEVNRILVLIGIYNFIIVIPYNLSFNREGTLFFYVEV